MATFIVFQDYYFYCMAQFLKTKSLCLTRFETTKQTLTNQTNILNKNITELFFEISKGGAYYDYFQLKTNRDF